MTTVGLGTTSAGSPAEWSAGGEDDAVAEALGRIRPGDADGGPALMTSPAVRVVHGRPDEVELAALVAGIVAARSRTDELGGLPDDAAERVRGRWTDRARVLGISSPAGAGTWRWSMHP